MLSSRILLTPSARSFVAARTSIAHVRKYRATSVNFAASKKWKPRRKKPTAKSALSTKSVTPTHKTKTDVSKGAAAEADPVAEKAVEAEPVATGWKAVDNSPNTPHLSIPNRVDPHQMAEEFVNYSASRPSGAEALASMTFEQKARNYGTAAVLIAFVTGVWWYSMQAVGKSEGGIEELRAEAQEALEAAGSKSLSEQEAEDLVGLEMGAQQSDDDGVIIAVAAPDEIATEEEERNIASARGGEEKGGSRPLWKKVVLFWKKE